MAQSDLVQDMQQLTYAGAAVAIEAAVAKSRALGAPECIAVVDAGGNLLALGMATGGIPFEFGANLAFASQGGITNLGGGLPITLGSRVLGAIGVGSGTTEQDVAVAEAGRDAILAALSVSK
jgi:glc operon protein GlcG